MKNLPILISLLLPFLFLLSCSMSLHTNLQSRCLDDQQSCLMQLQHHFYYAPNFTLSSKVELWDPNTDCCHWQGVACDAVGHVIELDLHSKNLSSSFHSIFNLHHLQRLNLAGNNFNSTLFQYRFGKLPNLTHLNLSTSRFYGQVPMEISSLTRLVSLDLSNQFGSYAPSLKLEKPNLKTLIKNKRSLRDLYLDGVDISSESSKWCEITSLELPKLSVLSMSFYGLTGPLCSSLLSLPHLSKLVLDLNPISYLPSNILKISSPLVSLSLRKCNLSGHFPAKLFLLPKMQRIDTSLNPNLTGQLPEFPINNATLELQSLTLFYCNFSGSIPASIANLTNLVELDLSFNNFTGLIPSSLSTLSSLRTLSLGGNQLGGEIDEFRNASFQQLEWLSLSSCNVTKFPEFIKTQDKLRSLDLSNNQIHGVFPEFLRNLENLEWLSLWNNKISGAVPNWVWKKSLWYLALSNNSLSSFEQCSILNHSTTSSQDSLSTPTCDFSQLVVFRASYNKFSGSIPSWLANISTLSELDLQKNNFSGSLPDFGGATELGVLQLNDNKLEGKLPRSLANCKSLRYLDLQKNHFSGIKHLPLNIWKMKKKDKVGVLVSFGK